MDIVWWRDLVIVVWGIIATLAMIFLTIIVYLFYRRTMSLLKSADTVVSKVSDIVDYAESEVIKPVIQFGTIVQGIVQGVGFFTDMFSKKEKSNE